MGDKSRKYPKLRFPGFTDPWEQRKLNEVVSRRSKTSKSNSLPTVEFEDINSGVGTLNKNIYRKSSHKSGIMFISGDILFGKLRPYLKNWLHPNFTGIAVGDFWVFDPQNNDGSFIYYLIQSPKYCEISNLSIGSKMPRSDWQIVSNTFFHIPNVEEQSFIGKIIKYIDNLIAANQREGEKLKNLKKSYMIKLFPKNGKKFPELRFPGFTDAWEQRKLSDTATFGKGQGYSKSDLTQHGFKIIIYGRMYTKYQTVIEPVDTYAENDKQFTHSRAGDVLVPASGETAADIARASTILYSGIIIGGDINIIEPKANEWDSIFLALDITYGKIKGELIKRAQGKSIVHLHNADLKTLSIYHPSLKEQQKISKLIMTVDNLIAANQREAEKLKNIKQSYLNELFV